MSDFSSLVVNDFCATNSISRTRLLLIINSIISEIGPVSDSAPDQLGTEPPIVVVAALSLEAAAVAAYLDRAEEVIDSRTGSIYLTGELHLGGGSKKVAIATVGPGNSASSAGAERAIQFFRPRVAVFVGVAGGIKDDVQIGDVVVGSEVYDYSNAKEGDGYIEARIKSMPASYAAIQRASAMLVSGSWVKVAGGDSVAMAVKSQPRAFIKPLAAGPRLLASTNSPTAMWIKSHCGDALAVEMEGIGFLVAAHAHPEVQSVVVRGISDLVDGKKSTTDETNQPMAASRAAAFGLCLASEMLDAMN